MHPVVRVVKRNPTGSPLLLRCVELYEGGPQQAQSTAATYGAA